ncbi:hypothetical protein B1C78_13075 [Thioalkalivibrio denitrificans]|uniref:Uncharacterized protein n=1 Tax=Thioalkalivibrio denitrificans TaxID=108003 RepID=A0A1V3NDN6_9GAMM|nr:hypothetical protein B1C78_13075 [Thioalkalivibrio denitrificans]
MLVVTGTGCLCLVILVLGTVLGVINGVISAELLGRVEGVGVGGGLLGLGVIIYRVIKASLEREPKS